MAESKYYWLKLKRDFFKRHDIRVIESMPNGKDYILFYLKLLLESIDHEGSLRFSETIPYNEEMLSVVANTNIDIVRSAMKLFVELGMIEILDDSTIYMNEVERMIGSAADNDNANRQRRFRERQKEAALLPRYEGVTKSNESKRESKSKNQSKRESIEKFIPPSVDEVATYCRQRSNGIDAQHFVDYYAQQKWKLSNGNKMADWQAAVRTWESREKKKKREVSETDGKHERIGEHLI